MERALTKAILMRPRFPLPFGNIPWHVRKMGLEKPIGVDVCLEKQCEDGEGHEGKWHKQKHCRLISERWSCDSLEFQGG
jgi:hypothetical protein